MVIDFDSEGWLRERGNRLPGRHMTQDKQEAARTIIEHQTNPAINIIERSNEGAWSQMGIIWKKAAAGLVKKARAVVDYRLVNKFVSTKGWPIPNIQELLQRLGSFRPTRFCLIDLKDGYWQAPLAKESQWITAFMVASLGLFIYTRVPMGIKCAASYFQFMMATVVLAGLVHSICEVYLDDIVVHDEGMGHAQFIKNLERVFAALDSRGIIINPVKLVCGVPQAVVLGHEIDSSGITHTRKQIDDVLGIEQPLYGKGMKSFLGVAQYFAPHIKNFALLAKPLHDLILDYKTTKNKKLVWTTQASDAFVAVKAAINMVSVPICVRKLHSPTDKSSNARRAL